MSVSEEVAAALDFEKVYEDAARESEEAEKAESSPALTPYFSRDYIPTQTEDQTEEQRAFLRTAAMPSREIGPRDYVPTADVPKDVDFAEKSRIAEEAAMRWQEEYTARMEAQAEKDVVDWNEAKLVSYMETLGLTDRQIYLRAERANKNRPGIFARFGEPIGMEDEGESESEQSDKVEGSSEGTETPAVENPSDGDAEDASGPQAVETPKTKTKTVRKNKE